MNIEQVYVIFITHYFEPGNGYTFENLIEFTFSNNNSNSNSSLSARQSDSISLTANGGPINGSCNVSPQKGVLLQDEFNFSCNGWIDSDSGDSKLTYNFIYDGFLFLKTSYDQISGINTLLGNGNHTITAVILDEYLVPSCVDMNVIVSDESNLYILSTQSLNEYELIDNNTLFVSNFVLLDVTSVNESASSPSSLTTPTASSDTTTWISQCDPIIIHFNHSNSSFFTKAAATSTSMTFDHFPLCSFYNESSLKFEDNGCYLLEYNEYESTCMCRHATYWGVNWQDFTPEISF